MGYGSTGKLLRVDLTRKAISVEHFDEAFYRLYPGGKALAAYLLLREIAPGVDPLGPDNVLVLVNGLITGAPISTATRFTAAARSAGKGSSSPAAPSIRFIWPLRMTRSRSAMRGICGARSRSRFRRRCARRWAIG